MMIYQNINVKTTFSLLSSIIKIDDYIEYGIKHNFSNLVVLDNDMSGCYEFYKKCKKHNINPVLGIDFLVKDNNQTCRIAIFARNYSGYLGLVKLSSHVNSHHSPEPLDLKMLINFLQKDYVFVFNPIEISEVQMVDFLIQNYGQDIIYYVGLCQGNIDMENKFIQKYGSEHILWFQPIYYFQKEDFDAYKTIKAIKDQILFRDLNNLENDFFMSFSRSDINSKYNSNLNNFFSYFNLEIQKQKYLEVQASYKHPNHKSSFDYLKALCIDSLYGMFTNENILSSYRERLDLELSIIQKKGFEDYFLVVYDYVAFAKSENIICGPGRGSAAGSLVAFLLNITTIDPIKYDLIFERFLNPERESLPDIDVDFEDDRRDEIINHILNKYGKKKVAHIVTFQTIGLKMGIRDIGRVFEVPIDTVNKVIKILDKQQIYSVEQLISFSTNIKELMEFPQFLKILPFINGLPRQTSTHAAGIIISNKDLDEIVPTKIGTNDILHTQYTMEYIEDNGLVKYDILGLKNLSILRNIIDQIPKFIDMNMTNNQKLAQIPLDNKETFALLREGKTEGIFQLESKGMTSLLKQMKVASIEEIAITSALYRPGPQANIPQYLMNKEKSNISYIDKSLQPILKETQGIIIYQEQVMLISQKIAGFSMAKADILRRAMAKKNQEQMTDLEAAFTNGGKKRGYQQETVQKIWKLILKFAEYGFNKSHAISYSLISYWMSYFKTLFSAFFFSQLLSSFIGNYHKTKKFLLETERQRIPLSTPSIHNCHKKYYVKDNILHMPLTVIKQIGNQFIDVLRENINKFGDFKDIYDFALRLLISGCSKQIYNALVWSGALDIFGINRGTLCHNYYILNNYAKDASQNNKIYNKANDADERPKLEIKTEDNLENSRKEFEWLGFYLTFNPIKFAKLSLNNKIKITKIDNLKFNENQLILVILKDIRVIKDKNSQEMAFLRVVDETGELDITCFHSIYTNKSSLLELEQVFLIEIKTSLYKKQLSASLEKIKKIKLDSRQS